ncbi:MAG: RNA 2',3'-cyclic phosphodiesterase [Deltaproteobacteria bacterium]|nr:RNA 2',3'-cyclic phosphodiesterase [Deltaproteobacteria bacterium]
MLRSFLAIELPATILKRIEEVQKDLKSSRADVRWVSPENIHLTLKFFGTIEESIIESIIKLIEGPVQGTPLFFLKIQGMGAFPGLKNPRVIWMGFQEGKEIIVAIQKQLERELGKIGFPPEDRPFHPHLTLGRMRSNRGKDELVRGMERYREEEFGNFQVEKVVLFKSELRPTGPIYTALREARLGEG